jgi:acyl-CoA thioester hydrolase
VNKFQWPIRIYYEDTDSGGVVYYANYLKYLERARTEFLRAAGYEQDELIRDLNLIFAVRSIAIEYHKPARFNDCIVATAELESTGKVSMVFKQDIYLEAQPDVLLTTATVKIASLDAQRFTIKPIPNELLVQIRGD